MAVPSLPADVVTANTISSSHMNSVLDLQQWFRDTAPVFRGQGWTQVSGTDPNEIGVTTATNTTVGFGTAGSFKITPVINIGSWTVQGSDADPESLVVPEAGYYHITIFCEWEANATGYRQIRLLDGGAIVAAFSDKKDAAGSGVTWQSVSGIVDLAASDQLDVQAYQNSGSQLDAKVFLTAHWIRST